MTEETGYETTIRKSITINRPLEEVYRAFDDLSFLSRFVEHLQEVKAEAESSSRWRWLSQIVEGRREQGEVEVAERRQGQLVRWRWLEEDSVRGEGAVSFRAAPGQRGTEVSFELFYDAPGGTPGRWLQRLMGTEPRQQLTRDLHRLRQLLEAGEIATTAGQPAARENTGGELLTVAGQPSGRTVS
jgi:uncharacterized membrane protein